jgi:radical SAM superfamily enzyme YgiQ (UPF0313 family)
MNCIYCTYPKISGNKLRLREADKVVEEVANLTERGVDEIFFSDSLFNMVPDHARTICEGMIEQQLPVSWHSFFNPKARYFTEELLDAMVESGVAAVQLGVDSGSDTILDTYQKGFDTQDIARATRMCQARGIPVSYSVLFGAPGESKETIDETFALIDELEPDYVDIELGVRIYKPTQIARLAEEQGIVARSDSLCEPTFYPFSDKDYVREQSARRPNCHICYTEQPVHAQLEGEQE